MRLKKQIQPHQP
ncbi:tonB-dependent Receptor Plug domain protein, partial [Yersinia pestis PY-09]